MAESGINLQRFLIKNRKMNTVGITPENNVDRTHSQENMERIWRYKEMWDMGYRFRQKRRRCSRYTYNDQWGDRVYIDGEWITESEHISRQGKAPLQNNMIRTLTKTVLGVFRQMKTEPECISRDRDEQELGEMMTIAMQRASQSNVMTELDADSLREFITSGVAIQVTEYTWDRKEQLSDVKVKNVNPARCFWNTDIENGRGEDLRCFGVLYDYTIEELKQKYAKTRMDSIKIDEIYSKQSRTSLISRYEALSRRRIDNIDFMMGSESDKCRVIEAWELEGKERIQVHDKMKGELFVIDIADISYIEQENERRLIEAVSNGISEEEAIETLLMEMKWFYDQYWVVRHLTPYGDILYEGETPYWHNEHPFTVLMYPMVDGETHSMVEDMIDQQRYINRLVTMIDFIMGASAKGVLVFPEDALGDMTKEEVLEEWVKYNGVIFAKIKPGGAIPQQISTNATNIGAYELLNLQLKMLQDVSGIHAALQGQQAKAGTPSTLYAQESQNSQTSIADMLDAFNEFRRRRDYKVMSLIQQYYDEPRYINIAGHNYSETAKWYNPERVRKSSFDIVITESPQTPAYRSIMNQFLLQIYQQGQMDLETLLETSSYPFSDKILRTIRAKQQAMMDMQQAMMGQQQGMMAGGDMIPEEVATQADPKAMGLINQALQGG